MTSRFSWPRLALSLLRSPARLASLAVVLLPLALRAQSTLLVYDDALAPGWGNWSWASCDFANTSVVHSGSDSIAVTAGAWTALSIQHDAFDSTGYGNLTFWINGGPSGGQKLNVQGTANHSSVGGGVVIGPLAANTWVQETIPLASLGVANTSSFTGFWLQEWTGSSQPTFYVDDVAITGSVPVTPPPPLNGSVLYQDSFTSGWQNWSWATVNSGNTKPVNSGTSSIAVDSGPYQALRFHHAPLVSAPYTSLTFWINGGNVGGQTLNLQALRSGNAQPPIAIGPLAPNTWQKITVPLAALGAANVNDLTDFWLQENGGRTLPTYYVDDVRLDFAPMASSANITVDASASIRTVDPRMFGVNTAIWDGGFSGSGTKQFLQMAQVKAMRFPGGSAADAYHWQTNTSDGGGSPWATNFDAFATVAASLKSQMYLTANYGSGSPAEAAAWVQYANLTKGYGAKYWEIGNENYGTWENDLNNRPHDPVTYANRFQQFYAAMKAVDPTIKIGAVVVTGEDSYVNYSDEVVTNPRTGQKHSGWTPVLLTTFASLGCTPDFVIYHRYEQNGGGEDDTYLLTSSATWPNDAANLRQMLNDYLGSAAAAVQLNCTENNSVSSNPGKQTTSLVNGLFLADALGNILQTEFTSDFWWDLHNGQETGNNNSPLLYGWRTYGDYGITSPADSSPLLAPATVYPTGYVETLLANFARGGETVVSTASDYWGLGAYAVRGANGTLRILLVNKQSSGSLSTTVHLNHWVPGKSTASVYQYGIPQDNAAQAGKGAMGISMTTIATPGPTFTYTAAPYSVAVIVVR